MSKWFDYFQRCGNVELAFRRAETWNEGVTGKRFKTNPVDFVTLTLRTDGITTGVPPAEDVTRSAPNRASLVSTMPAPSGFCEEASCERV